MNMDLAVGELIWLPIMAIIYNVIVYIMFCTDKKHARRQRSRIPENVLLGTAVLFGAPGAYLGMVVNRHKTLHPRFFVGIPAAQCLQLIAIIIATVLVTKQTGKLYINLILVAVLWLLSFLTAIWKEQHRSPKRKRRRNDFLF